MLIDHWGNVLARADGDSNCVIFSEINAAQREEHRQRLPALSHRLIK
jgi:predicted amidohydrolase